MNPFLNHYVGREIGDLVEDPRVPEIYHMCQTILGEDLKKIYDLTFYFFKGITLYLRIAVRYAPLILRAFESP